MVIGKWAEWSKFGDPVAVQNAGVLAPLQDQSDQSFGSPVGYRGMSQADMVSHRQLRLFITSFEVAWYHRPHPRGRFRTDITSDRTGFNFSWRAWVQSLPPFTFRELVGEEAAVSRVEVAWSEIKCHPVLVFTRTDSVMVTVDPLKRDVHVQVGDHASSR